MNTRLIELGWSPHFQAQILPEDDGLFPCRVTEVQRARALGLGADGLVELSFPKAISAGDVAVGDWVMAEEASGQIGRLLDRLSLLQRKAAGIEIKPQLIAANVSTLFITTSCNEDFNIPRLERYVAMALEADCHPVIILTKADQCDAIDTYEAQAWALSPRIADVIALNAKDIDQYTPLRRHLGTGQTVAFVGSSGVGKSTLIKRLTGLDLATGEIREDDAKGRHTTTHRALYTLPEGGLVIDMPGMRELALFDAAGGIDDLFSDIVTLAGACKFRDCAHDGEPGCAIGAAMADGTVDRARFERWRKLKAEDAYHSETIHEARARGKSFARMVKDVKKTRRDKFRK